jgi:hypothetical protein
MFAVLASVSVDPAQTESARSMLQDQIVPMVKASAGFVGGYWLAPVDGKAVSVVVFDTEANARAGAPPVGPAPAPGVTIDSVEIREVSASA